MTTKNPRKNIKNYDVSKLKKGDITHDWIYEHFDVAASTGKIEEHSYYDVSIQDLPDILMEDDGYLSNIEVIRKIFNLSESGLPEDATYTIDVADNFEGFFSDRLSIEISKIQPETPTDIIKRLKGYVKAQIDRREKKLRKEKKKEDDIQQRREMYEQLKAEFEGN